MDSLTLTYPQKFSLYHYRFHIVAIDPLILPAFKGSTLRGALGYALQQTVCRQESSDCQSCSQKLSCLYTQVFNTPTLGMVPDKPKLRDAPRPFVLRPTLENTSFYPPGAMLYFEIVLFIDGLLHTFIQAVNRMGQNGVGCNQARFWLREVSDNIADHKTVYHHQQPEIASGTPLRFADIVEPGPGDRFSLYLLTPLRMIAANAPRHTLDFAIIVRNLWRRLKLLNAFYGDDREWQSDPSLLFEQAQQVRCLHNRTYWHELQRNSSQRGKMQVGGLLGQIVFSGSPTPFARLLKMGEHCHIGKLTTMGFGAYGFSVEPPNPRPCSPR